MGYGLVAINKNKITLVEMGTLQLARKKDHAERLKLIFTTLESLIQLHRPMAVAIEAPFFGKNVQSMLKLGRAQGVAIAAAMMNGLTAAEYAPRKVKQSITGRGNASKEQVWAMLQQTLSFTEDPKYMDATDAVSVALCHYYEMKQQHIIGNHAPELAAKKTTKGKKSAWAAFAVANPDRVR